MLRVPGRRRRAGSARTPPTSTATTASRTWPPASLRFANGATGTLTSVWHDNLARPSLRRVEMFCERRHIVIEGDDWFGPVSWTDSDGTTGSIAGDALDRRCRPDARRQRQPRRRVRARDRRRPRLPLPTCSPRSQAHRIVDAMYASAAADGAAVDRVDDDDRDRRADAGGDAPAAARGAALRHADQGGRVPGGHLARRGAPRSARRR